MRQDLAVSLNRLGQNVARVAADVRINGVGLDNYAFRDYGDARRLVSAVRGELDLLADAIADDETLIAEVGKA